MCEFGWEAETTSPLGARGSSLKVDVRSGRCWVLWSCEPVWTWRLSGHKVGQLPCGGHDQVSSTWGEQVLGGLGAMQGDTEMGKGSLAGRAGPPGEGPAGNRFHQEEGWK